MSSVQEILNYLYSSPNLSNSEISSMITAFQGLNPRLDDFVALELIIFSAPRRTKTLSTLVMPSEALGLRRSFTKKRSGQRGIFKRIPVNPNTYVLIHNTCGHGKITYSDNQNLRKFLGGAIFSGDNCIVIDHNSNKFNNLTEISVATWLYLASTIGGETQTLFDKKNFSVTITHPNTINANISISGNMKTVSAQYTPNTWFSLVVQWKSDVGLILKINNIISASMSASGNFDNSTDAFVIGASSGGGFTSSGFTSQGFEL